MSQYLYPIIYYYEAAELLLILSREYLQVLFYLSGCFLLSFSYTLPVRGKGLCFFLFLSLELLQETDRPSDVSGGPVSAPQPKEVQSGGFATNVTESLSSQIFLII